MLYISPNLSIPIGEITFTAIRAQGPGGQNVNKVASAIQLRFDVPESSLSDAAKARILAVSDQRITVDGVIVIKAQNHRTQNRNKDEALERLADLLKQALHRPKARRATRPSRSSREKRLKSKAQRGQVKSLRGQIKRGGRDFD